MGQVIHLVLFKLVHSITRYDSKIKCPKSEPSSKTIFHGAALFCEKATSVQYCEKAKMTFQQSSDFDCATFAKWSDFASDAIWWPEESNLFNPLVASKWRMIAIKVSNVISNFRVQSFRLLAGRIRIRQRSFLRPTPSGVYMMNKSRVTTSRGLAPLTGPSTKLDQRGRQATSNFVKTNFVKRSRHEEFQQRPPGVRPRASTGTGSGITVPR